MKRRKGLLALCALAALALAGTGSCEKQKLSDSIEPFQKYMDRMLKSGETKVPINEAIAYYVGESLAPESVDPTTVSLWRAGSGNPVPGEVTAFDDTNCVISGALTRCPRGIGFTPGGGVPCDLDPDTDYELVLYMVMLTDGTSIPKTTITFHTGPAPAGYTPDLCSAVAYQHYEITGDTLDATAGIGGDLAGETTQLLDIVAVGVENQPTFHGAKDLINRYLIMLEIQNLDFGHSDDYDLGTTVRWINIKTLDGVNHKVYLPSVVIGLGQTLALYIADDGSTYYAINPALAGASTYDIINSGDCDSPPGGGCPALLPTAAFGATYLAAPADASPSTTPLILARDTLSYTDGLNGGILAGDTTTWSSIYFKVQGVNARSPYMVRKPGPGNLWEDYSYYGWDQLNNSNELSFSYIDGFFGYVPNLYPGKSSHSVGQYQCLLPGYGYLNNIYPHFGTTPTWLLLYVYNKGAASYSVAGRTVIVKDNLASRVVTLPSLTIPAGQALPLYVSNTGLTFYAGDSLGVHTLDPIDAAAPCDDNSQTCPLLDPINALTDAHLAGNGVAINEPLAFYRGKDLLVRESLNPITVRLYQSGSVGPIPGEVTPFDYLACQVSGASTVCPRGIDFTPGGGAPCDLDPDTEYELVLDGVQRADGSPPLPLTVINFHTGPVPAAYTPYYCSDVGYLHFTITGNTLETNAGIGGDLAGETTQLLDIVAVGVENQSPYSGSKDLINRYLIMLQITNLDYGNFDDYDLGTTVRWINIKTLDGVNHKIYLPSVVIGLGQTLALYVADDGSTYYAINPALAGASTYDIASSLDCDSAGGGCPALSPSLVFGATYLAAPAGASPSTTPLILARDSLGYTDGLNGGILAGATTEWSSIIFKVQSVNARPPYYGWDQLNNYNELGFSYIDSYFGYFLNLVPGKSSHMVGQYQCLLPGASYQENTYPHFGTLDSWLLLYIYNKGAASYTVAGRTVTITDHNVSTLVALPSLSIPAGEALPLYVSNTGFTFYAYDSLGAHTLDPIAAHCDDSPECPLLDPINVLTVPYLAAP